MNKKKTNREFFANFNIAGFTYYDGVLAFEDLKIGTQLEMVAELDNHYDPQAVAIYYNEYKLGYVPKSHNSVIHKLLKVEFSGLDLRVQRINVDEHPEQQLNLVLHFVPAK